MATIFDYIKDITVTKRADMPIDQYVPYITTRWLSFINPTVGAMMNEVNKQVLLENKEMHYKTLLSMFPKMKYCPRIKYVKKVKEDKEEKDTTKVSILAQNMELSKREVEQLLQQLS